MATALATLACLPALPGAAWDTYDLHFYAGAADGALAGAPGATAGTGWQAKRLYLAGEGSWYGIADRGSRRLEELTGVQGTSVGLFRVAAAGGLAGLPYWLKQNLVAGYLGSHSFLR